VDFSTRKLCNSKTGIPHCLIYIIEIMVTRKKGRSCVGNSSKLQESLSNRYNLSFGTKQKKVPSVSSLLSIAINPQIDHVDWTRVEFEAESRTCQSSHCAICHEYYRLHGQDSANMDQWILSCSHIFHTTCLSAFENYVKDDHRFCPLCREEKYEKRLTTIGSKCRKTQAVIVLQAFLRAWKARYLFRQSLGSYYSSNSSNDTMLETRREKFYMKELEGLGNKLLRKLSSNTIAVDKVSASIEQTLELSRGIIQSLNDRKTLPSAVDWRIIMKTAFERRHEVEGDQVLPTCAICMSAFEKKKEVCLTETKERQKEAEM
jgi:hypothetical protein